MIKIITKSLYFLFLSLFVNNLYSQDTKWKELFKKDDLSEFIILNGNATFQIENKILIGTSKLNTPNTFLATKKIFSDFILEFEVKIDDGLNSGVQFRSNSYKDYYNGRVHGYQCEIETSKRRWAGGIYDEARRQWLYPLTRNPKSQNSFKNGKWNHFRIEAYGNNIKTYVNGVQTANLVDEMTSSGFIAFQIHSINDTKDNGKKVMWKNIRIIDTNVKKYILPEDKSVDEISYLENKLTELEKENGFKLIWDGKSSKGWRGNLKKHFPKIQRV